MLIQFQAKQGGSPDFTKSINTLLDFVCQNTHDKIANVRFLAVETLLHYKNIIIKDQSQCLKIVKEIRQVFKAEKDAEVKNIIKILHKDLKNYV